MLSEETKQKIGEAHRRPFPYTCDYCGRWATAKPSAYNRSVKHFCCQNCYSLFRKEIMKAHEQPTWRGGVSNTESHRRWKKKNQQRMAHLRARRYAREKGADGSHTLEQWNELKSRYNFRCAHCGKEAPLTKDHIKPLSLGGTDYIDNIQPLCRSCNSKKWKKSNENLDLIGG